MHGILLSCTEFMQTQIETISTNASGKKPVFPNSFPCIRGERNLSTETHYTTSNLDLNHLIVFVLDIVFLFSESFLLYLEKHVTIIIVYSLELRRYYRMGYNQCLHALLWFVVELNIVGGCGILTAWSSAKTETSFWTNFVLLKLPNMWY